MFSGESTKTVISYEKFLTDISAGYLSGKPIYSVATAIDEEKQKLLFVSFYNIFTGLKYSKISFNSYSWNISPIMILVIIFFDFDVEWITKPLDSNGAVEVLKVYTNLMFQLAGIPNTNDLAFNSADLNASAIDRKF